MQSRFIPIVIVLLAASPTLGYGQHESRDHASHTPARGAKLPTQAGQDAYGAIAEIVLLLEADSTTDWSKVDLERLRQHLITMNEVTLNAAVEQRAIAAGLEMKVSGTGRTVGAIRAMARAHTAELNRSPQWRAEVAETATGVVFTVRVTDPADQRLVTRIRALGFVGLLTLGDHHGPHHLALAQGVALHGHE